METGREEGKEGGREETGTGGQGGEVRGGKEYGREGRMEGDGW